MHGVVVTWIEVSDTAFLNMWLEDDILGKLGRSEVTVRAFLGFFFLVWFGC
jgi:hypothetical protein